MNQGPVQHTPSPDETQSREEQIERLTREASQLISTAERGEREELRDYAISLLQRETETGPFAEAAPTAEKRAPFNPLALAIPLVLIGAILFFLFPPVGIILFLAAALAGVWGILRPLLYRRT